MAMKNRHVDFEKNYFRIVTAANADGLCLVPHG